MKAFTNVGSGDHTLLCVSHCVCICVRLLMSLGGGESLEDFWKHPCDAVRSGGGAGTIGSGVRRNIWREH